MFKMSTIFKIYFTFHYLNVNKLGYTSALLYDRKTYQPWKEWFLYYLYFCVEKKINEFLSCCINLFLFAIKKNDFHEFYILTELSSECWQQREAIKWKRFLIVITPAESCLQLFGIWIMKYQLTYIALRAI